MARRPSQVLTEKQQAVVDAVLTGQPVSAVSKNPTLSLRSETVQREIAAAREELSDLTTLKRVDIIAGLMDGIEVSRMTADGGNVIRGWTEIGKILGLYAPEVKQINLNIEQQKLRSKFETLSDEDLLRIVEGEVISDSQAT